MYEYVSIDRLDGDNFVIEFEQLPHDEHIQKLRKTIQQLRDAGKVVQSR